ncbi:MAG: PQQ-binding-like beta-propeller repeat protein [Acidobacteria bacterium]|nr:PQQ-binding-like beta-propeller repeat protein [Acidobacteriota bacterium]
MKAILGASFTVAALALATAGLHARQSQSSGPPPAAARSTNAAAPEADGAGLFKTYCAICHEGAKADAQAPTFETLRRLSAEQVLAALERGSMRARAAERSRAQRRALAAFVSGKPLADSGGPMPASAFCSGTPAPAPNPLAGPAWNGWGLGITNARFQSAKAAGMTAADVPRLRLKWAFGFPGASSAGTQPVVAGGRVYVATAEGELYVLDAKTGCVHWTLEVDAAVRSAITLEERSGGALVAYFGDQAASVYAVDTRTRKALWKVRVDDHPHAAITAAPQLHDGRLYVSVSSREESQVGDPRYPCCSFRGSVVALDAATGKRLWKTYTVSETPVATTQNSIGTQLYGPAGGAVWNTPTIDTKRHVLYVGTGNNFAPPATPLSDSLLALDLDTGRVRWSRQVTENDIWNGSCRAPNREAAVCPDKDAPDFDFTGSSLLVDVGGGRQLIVVGNKSGVIVGFDPDASGRIVWERRVAQGGTSGGVFWGSATDGANIYAANADFVAENPGAGGGMHAVDLRTGRLVWSVPGAGCASKTPCKPSQNAAVTLIPGAAFSGTMDGRLRAYSTRDGTVLWEYDTAREFDAVNHVKANGGSMSNGGPAIAGGMLFVNSGYSHHGGILPGNALLAFSPE